MEICLYTPMGLFASWERDAPTEFLRFPLHTAHLTSILFHCAILRDRKRSRQWFNQLEQFNKQLSLQMYAEMVLWNVFH